MPYYHVFITYRNKNGRPRKAGTFGWSEAFVKEKIAIPYVKNKPFMFGGIVVHPSSIDAIDIFESEVWEAKKIILPNGNPVSDKENPDYIVNCFRSGKVKGVEPCTWDFITSPPEEKEPKLAIDLMESATFLGLDTNWSLATCALQLQEVAVTLMAKRKNIKLDKENVGKLLNKKIESPSFNDKYEAFSRHVKTLSNIEMPILATHLRKMRVKVLHEGYNPKPEETKSIVTFTIGLLQKLNGISKAT